MGNGHKEGVALSYLINTGKSLTAYLEKSTFEVYIESLNTVLSSEKLRENVSFSYIRAFEEEFQAIKKEDLEVEQVDDISKMASVEWKRLLGRATSKEAKKIEEVKAYLEAYLYLFEKIVGENVKENGKGKKEIDFINVVTVFKLYEKLSKIAYRA